MTEFNPSEDLKKYLHESPIQSYRLVDGSYVIAEEVDRDEQYNVLYLAGALEFVVERDGKGFLKPWLQTEEDDFVQVSGDKVVGTTDTPFHLKMHYHRYFIVEKLQDLLTPKEMSTVLKQMFNPPVDNQDFMDDIEEGEEWKIDDGIVDSDKLQEDKGFKSISDFHTEWRRRHKGNN